METAIDQYKLKPLPAERKLFREVTRLSMKLGPKAPLVLGGAVTATAFLAGEILDSTTTGCGEIYKGVVPRNPDNHCEITYEINKDVLNILDLQDDEIKRKFREKPVRAYYEKLCRLKFEQPKFTNLECRPQGFKLKTIDAEGRSIDYSASYFTGSQHMRQISWKGPTPTSWGGPVRMTEAGIVRDQESPIIAKAAVPLRLFIMDAQECCTSTTERQACLDAFNPNSPAPQPTSEPEKTLK